MADKNEDLLKTKLPGEVLGEDYRIHSFIGEGGFSWVFKAVNEGTGTYVAIKVLRPELTETTNFVDRFNAEAVVTAKLRHRNIVRVFDFFCCQPDFSPIPLYCIVMEYLEGPTVKDLLLRGGPLSASESLKYIKQICRALSYAHNLRFEAIHGIIHRDVKPGNLKRLSDGRIKVLDFGIAKCLSTEAQSSYTSRGTVVGSYRYMSPEQLQGAPKVTPAADIFSLGVVLYEMLVGETPFTGSIEEVKKQQESGRYPAILDKRPYDEDEIPILDELDHTIKKCLEYHASRRFDSAESLYHHLDHLERRIPRVPLRRRLKKQLRQKGSALSAILYDLLPSSVVTLLFGFSYSILLFGIMATAVFAWHSMNPGKPPPVVPPGPRENKESRETTLTLAPLVWPPTATPTAVDSFTPTASPSPTLSFTPTSTFSPTKTPTKTKTKTPTKTSTPRPTLTSTFTRTPTPSPDPTHHFIQNREQIQVQWDRIVHSIESLDEDLFRRNCSPSDEPFPDASPWKKIFITAASLDQPEVSIEHEFLSLTIENEWTAVVLIDLTVNIFGFPKGEIEFRNVYSDQFRQEIKFHKVENEWMMDL